MRSAIVCRAALSTGIAGLVGRDRDDEMRRVVRAARSISPDSALPSNTKGSMPACRAPRIFPASASFRRSRLPGSRPRGRKSLAGIAGAEDEDALPSCLRRLLAASSANSAHVRRGSPFGQHLRVCLLSRPLRRQAPANSGRRISRESAHTAAPRTSGEASASSARHCAVKRRVAGIAGRDQHVAQEAVAADALDRRARKQRAECRIVQRQQIGQRRLAQIVARGQASPPTPPGRTCSTGRRPGNRRSHRCGCRSPRGIRAGSAPCSRW